MKLGNYPLLLDARLNPTEFAGCRFDMLEFSPRSRLSLERLNRCLDFGFRPNSFRSFHLNLREYLDRLSNRVLVSGNAATPKGGIEGAKAALREALRVAPGHETAKANLDALERLGGGRHVAASATPDAGARSAIDQSEVEENVVFSSWRPEDMAAALGLTVDYLSRKPAFARLQFGEWSQVLRYQVARERFFFVVDQTRTVQGFLGWALTREDLAAKWLDGRVRVRDDECLEGDRVIINAFAAESRDAKRFIVNSMRELFANKGALYFKRYYRDGRTRPMRLNVNDFVASHLSRRLERCENPGAGDHPTSPSR
jgi:hemolysin-activating ACP:hemolysin acyltransferase